MPALFIRLIGINHGLPYNNRIFYETEEPYTIKTAMAFGTGDFNPHAFNKPSLFYYLLFFFYALFFVLGKFFGYFHSVAAFAAYYFNNLNPFYLIARVVVALFGAASVYIIYLIGKVAYSHKTGIIASLFLSVCGVHVWYSRYAQVDIPQVFFVLLSVYFALRLNSADKLLNYALAGLFAGMAASTKYYGGLCIVVPVITHFLNRRGFDRKLFCLIALCIAGFLLFTPFALLDYRTFLKNVYYTKLWAQDTTLISEPLPVWGIQYIKDLFEISNLGLFMTVLSLIGILYSAYKHSKYDIALLLFILTMYGYFSLSKMAWSSVRYILPVIPLFILLGARLLVDGVSLLPSAKVLLPAFVLLFSLQPAVCNIKNGYLLSHKSTTNLAKEWIEGHIPARSKIIMDIFFVPQLTLTHDALMRFKDYWRLNTNQTGEDLRVVLDVSPEKRSKLFDLKDASITENGVPYDVYFTDYDNFLSLSDYVKRYNIQYVILSSWVEDIYNGTFRSARRSQANYFYNSVRKGAFLLKEFLPNDTSQPGTGISIYAISKIKASDKAR